MLVLPLTGAGPRPGAARREALGLLALLFGLALIPGYLAFETWAAQRAMIQAWSIAGPPCPQVARPSRAVVGSKPAKAFAYGGVGFARHFGHASCVAWRQGAPFRPEILRVCQFNAPGAVTVSIKGRTTSYQTGVSKPATVTIRDGTATCVAAGWFRD